MSHSRIPSPARSQDAPVTPRRYKSRTRSVGSPARSTTSGRLSALIQFKESNKDSFALSPAPSRRSVLNDDTDIEEPRRRSWWKKLADNSRDVMEVLNDNKILETNEAVEEYIDIEVLSQEKKNYSIDIPESSDSESISSIVIPQRKLFTQKDPAQNKFGQLIGTRETLAKLHKSHVADKIVNVAPKNLFGQGKKTRTKPVFPAALLNLSPNKTANKTKENVAAEVKGQVRNLFGNRAGTKRKNMFADFIVSESEDEISEIQPRVFEFPKKADTRRDSANSRGKRERSPTSSITTDIEMDDWRMLPSSTMVENQLEDIMAVNTPVKRARLSKLAETKESETKTTIEQIEKEPSDEEQELKYDDDDDKSDQEQLMPNSHEFEDVGDKDQQDNKLKNSRSKHTEEKEMTIGTNKLNQECIHNKSLGNLQNISKERVQNLNQSGIITKTRKVEENEEQPQKPDDQAQKDTQCESKINKQENDRERLEKSDIEAQNEPEDEIHNENEVNEKEDEAKEHDIAIEDQEKSETENDVSETIVENDKELEDYESENNAQDQSEAEEQNKSSAEAQNETKAEMQDSEIETNGDEVHQGGQEELEDDEDEVQNYNEAESKKNEHNESKLQMQDENADIQDEMEEDLQNESAKTQKEIENKDHNKSSKIQRDTENNEVQSDNEFENEQNKSEVEMQDKMKKDVQNKSPKTLKETEDDEVQNDSEAENEGNEMQDEIIEEVQNKSDIIQEEMEDEDQNDGAKIQEEMEDEDQNDGAEIQEEMEDEDQNDGAEIQEEMVDEDQNDGAEIQEGMEDDEQNESAQIQEEIDDDEQNDSIEIQEEMEDDGQNESADVQEENEDDEDEQNESAEIQEENEDDEQNESSEIQDNMEEDDPNESTEEDQNDGAEIPEEMEDDEQNESAQIQEETEDEEQDQSAETQDEIEEHAQNESQEAQEESENEIQDSNDQQESDNEQELRNETHDTTGRYRRKNETEVHSPEAILHDKTNQLESFTAKGRNTSIRKTTMLKNLNIRPSLAPPRESTGLSDGTNNSSAEGSGWDSHRTTRKTLRQTFGRDFTPRKSLRALVMEKSAKRQTAVNETTSVTAKFPQANSTELPEASMAPDDTEIAAESIHDVSQRTRQTTLEMYLQKIKKQNLERKLKMEEAVRNSLKAPTKDVLNPFKVPSKPIFSSRKPNKVASKSKAKQVKSTLIPLEDLPAEVIEDMKYKPPKRFQPSNASWITKRLYKFLESKLESKYDYKARLRAEKLVETIYHFAKDLRRVEVAPSVAVDALKHEMARLDVVKTHFDFYQFFHEYMPREIRVKVVPDVVNRINVPRHGVFSDIIRGNTVQG